jgi:adenylate cyclase
MREMHLDAEPAAIAPDVILAWLQSEGVKFRETAPFLEAFANELLRAGIDVARATTGVPILHPQLYSLSCLWRKGAPVTERRYRLEGGGDETLQHSPMAVVYAGGAVRCRLEGPPETGEFPILADLRAEGMTDYAAWPLPFSDGTWKGITFGTRLRGGFPPEQIRTLESLVPMLSRLLEIQASHRTALTLLDTYVGTTAGRRVLDGAIKRGM